MEETKLARYYREVFLQMTKLTYEKFMKTLQKEHKYHKDEGTSYRQETARLAIEVAKVIKETDFFLDPSFAR